MDDERFGIKNGRALSWLLVLIVGLGTAYRVLKTVIAERPFESPPWLVVLIIFITALALLLSQQEKDADENSLTTPTRSIPVQVQTWLNKVGYYWRFVVIGLAAFLIIYVLYRIPKMVPSIDQFDTLLRLWIAAIALYLLALLPSPNKWQWDGYKVWQEHKREILLVGMITLVALILRLWRLDTIPFTLSGDEGSQGLEAIRVLEGQIVNPFATGWLGVPTMSFFFNSISIDLLGRTVMGLRLPWALVGAMAVLVTFYLVKQLKGTNFALIVAFLVATYHYHIHFSRLGSNQIADPFFMALSLLFLYRALNNHRWVDWALAGGSTGLAFYFYAGARLTAIIMLAVIAYEFIRQPRQFWQQHRIGFIILLGGFLLVGSPIIQYALRFPDEFNARINAVGIIQSGWLEREITIRQESMAAILFDQFQRSALAFNYYQDRTVWYGLPQPLLDPLFGVLFLLGLGICTLRLWGKTADTRSAAMVAWWWGGIILGGMFTESPPSSQRLISLAIPTCFFIGVALWELAQLTKKSFQRVSGNVLLTASVGLFAVLSLITYFADYTPARIYGGPNAELATEIVPRLRQLSPDHRIYFVGAPAMYWGFGTLPYLIPAADAIDLTESFAEQSMQDLIIPDKEAVFVVLPLRSNELELIQNSYPDGEIFNYFSPVDGRLMVTLYVVNLE